MQLFTGNSWYFPFHIPLGLINDHSIQKLYSWGGGEGGECKYSLMKGLITCGLFMLKCYSCSLIVLGGILENSLDHDHTPLCLHFINIFCLSVSVTQKNAEYFAHLWFSEMYAKEAEKIAVFPSKVILCW